MRTFKPLGALALLLALACVSAGSVSARDVTFASPAAALEQGIGAFKGGHYQIAVPALTFAADAGEFFGRYYLAQLYADNNSAYTDHGKAYKLFLHIVDENANADPDDDQRAPYVGKALTAVASYTRSGLPEIALPPNAERAAKFFRDSATFFRDFRCAVRTRQDASEGRRRGAGPAAGVPLAVDADAGRTCGRAGFPCGPAVARQGSAEG